MRNLFLLLILTISLNTYSQTKQPTDKVNSDAMLFGDVKDSETGEHLPYVNIMVKNTTLGTTTDATGHYMFSDLPIGKITLVVSFVGYKTIEKVITTVDNKGHELFFLMEYDAIMTDQVVVSADRNAMSRGEAPVIVSALSIKQLDAIQTNTVADGLSFSPGLRVETNCQNCGFTQLRMNGLEGAYSQILVNSRPVFSGLAGVYGLEQIPTEMVERIEVVRGGGSSIFGGSAIGGTVNIITKDPINNTFNISAKTSAFGLGTNSDNVGIDKRLNFNGAIVTDDLKAGVFIFGMHQERDHWDANNDGFSEIVQMENTSAGFQAYYKPNQKSRLSVEYHNLSEHRRGGDKFGYKPHEANIAEDLVHNNNSAGLTYETFFGGKKYNKMSVYASGQSVDRNSYYGANQDPSAYGYTTGLTSVVGTQFVFNVKDFKKTNGALTLGVENQNDIVKDNKLGYDSISNMLITHQMSNTLGSYAQYQMNFNKFKLLLGFRLDRYSIKDYDSETDPVEGLAFNPRGNILYDITKEFQLRVSYSTGYRAPQIFDEDLHIEASGARRIEHRNSDNLEEERSQSVSGSIRMDKDFGRWDVEFLVEGFYTKLMNPFVKILEDQGNGLYYSVRSNSTDGAKVYGSNLELTMAPSRKLFVQMGGTIQASTYDSAQPWGADSTSVTKEITRTPATYAYIITTFDITKKLNASISGNYTGKMFVPHLAGGTDSEGNVILNEKLVTTKNFYVLNFNLAYTFKLSKTVKIEAYAGMKNILNSYQTDFDSGIDRDAGYVYGPMMPRSAYVGLKFKL